MYGLLHFCYIFTTGSIPFKLRYLGSLVNCVQPIITKVGTLRVLSMSVITIVG